VTARRWCGSALIPWLLAAGAVGAAPQSLTLEQAIGFALRQNRDLQTARLACEDREVALAEARDEFRFTFTPRLSAGWDADAPETTAGAEVARKTILGSEVTAGAEATRTEDAAGAALYRGTATLQLTQPLLRGAGPLVVGEPLTQAGHQVLTARRDLELRKTDLVMQTAELYESILQLQTEQELENATVERLRRLARLTAVKERQGRASRADALRAELRLGEAGQRQLRLSEQLAVRRADLAELLGFAPDVEFAAEPWPVPEIVFSNRAEAVSAALSNRLDYAQLLQDHAEAQRGITLARRNLWPDLRLVTRYTRSGEGPAAGDATSWDDDTWFVGLRGETDLPDRSAGHELRRAGLAEDVARIRLDRVRDAIGKQVLQITATYERARADRQAAARNYRLAQGRMAAARRLFELGRGDSFSVGDAEDDLKNAELAWLSAQSEAALTAYRFLRATGTLVDTPDVLKPGEALP